MLLNEYYELMSKHHVLGVRFLCSVQLPSPRYTNTVSFLWW